MAVKFTVGVSTVSFVGYSLTTAFDHIANAGYHYVEIAAVEGGLEHLTQEQLTPSSARTTLRQLETRGLKTNALSAHSPLTNRDAVERFGTRLRFAADIGAPVCVTSAGSPDKLDTLTRNLESLVALAERLKVSIALETNADLVTVAQDAARIINIIGSPWIGLNYDPANVYRATNGEVEPVTDFRPVVDSVMHVHIKDMHETPSGWAFCVPGVGVIDTAGFLRVLRRRKSPVGVNLELPYRLRLSRLNGKIVMSDSLPNLADIDKDLLQIRELIESMLLVGI